MKKTAFCLCLSILSFVYGEDLDSTRIVRVMTYNIYHGETMDHDFDLGLIAGVIDSLKPDFVALQEVDFFTERARKMDLATELGWRLKMAPFFGEAMPFDGGSYGEGVLSRHVVQSSKNYPLSCSEGNEPRAALSINVLLNGKDGVFFIGTHLDHTVKNGDRLSQAREINAYFKKDGIPMILAGDMNARPESPVINEFEKIWRDCAADKDFKTYPAVNPKQRIDYIFVKPKNRWKTLEIHPVCHPSASDHCGVFAVLYLKPE